MNISEEDANRLRRVLRMVAITRGTDLQILDLRDRELALIKGKYCQQPTTIRAGDGASLQKLQQLIDQERGGA